MDAATEMRNEEVQLHVYGFMLYDEKFDAEMRYVDGGPYYMAAEGLTGTGEHLGLGADTGVRGQGKEQGCVISEDVVSNAGLQEEVLILVYVLPRRGGLRKTAVRRARTRAVHTFCPGRGRRRGCISLISRWISRRPSADPNSGSLIRLLNGPTAACQLGRQSRPWKRKDAPMPRELLRSTRGARLGEFEGRVLCLGRGRDSLSGDALLRAATTSSLAGARGTLARLCEVGGAYAMTTAELMGSTGCLGRKAANGSRRVL